MRFFKFLLLAFLANSLAQAGTSFEQHLAKLDSQAKEMQLLEQLAVDCMPSINAEGAIFCTGIQIEKTHLDQMLKLDFKSCRNQILKAGYSAQYDGSPDGLTSNEYQSFIHSTKRAETFHARSVVMFKRSLANRIDCLHELLHVYQWTHQGKNQLRPLNRKQLAKDFEDELIKAIHFIAQAEKKGQKAKAISMGNKLNTHIKQLKAWGQLHDWLDEKEVHYFIYKNCQKLGCSYRDMDIALANLNKRKAHMSAAYQQEISNAAKHFIKRVKNISSGQ